LIPIDNLFKKGSKIYAGNNRHEALLRVMESLIARNSSILSEQTIKDLSQNINQTLFIPPLEPKEFEKQWNDAKKFMKKNLAKDGNELLDRQTRVSISDILTLVKERYTEIIKDQINNYYVTVKINDHTECIPLQSSRFKNIIRKEYFDKSSQLISDDKLEGIVKLLESQSMYDDNIPRADLTLRVARVDSQNDGEMIFYYDLTNPKWEIIKIDPNDSDWQIVKGNTLPVFKRYENNCIPQVYPSKEYDEDTFDQFLGLFNFGSRKDVLLFSVYLITLFVPDIPKVILILKGTGGGAKTTAFRMTKEIIDPCSVDTLSFPKQINDLIQMLDHHYVVFFDNICSISDEVSDILCRAVTGSGNIKRALYPNDSDFVYKFRRGIGINGINLVTTKSDFIDRSLILEVKRIDNQKRRKEDEIQGEFKKLKASVLGYIFSILLKVLKYKKLHPEEKIVNNGYPRMADFAEWGELISRTLGYESNEFLKAYQENIDRQVDEIIESSPVAEAIVTYINKSSSGYWEGTPTSLYKTLTDVIDQEKPDLRRSSLWPKASNALTSTINDVLHNLKEKGVEVITGERDNRGNRIIKIKKLVKADDMNDVLKEGMVIDLGKENT
jgi:hypothetical protein